MDEAKTPRIGIELLRIHSIITRGLNVATEHCQSFAGQGCSGIALWNGFVDYVRSFASVLHAHHHTEDQLAFPYFRDKFPDAPYALLAAQHQDLVPILDQVKTTVEEMAAHSQERKLLDNLAQSLKRISEFWHPHIQMEEAHFAVDEIDSRIDLEEQARLCRLFVEHSQQIAGPDFLVVPFLLYNLPIEERSVFAQGMPTVVTEHLIPVVWKEKWEPMKPFLLS